VSVHALATEGPDRATSDVPTVSVVICAYSDERWTDLQSAVESIRRQSRAAHEIVVVIDHNPALADMARERLAGALVVENSAERGLSGARNTGFAAAGGEVVAFLDDDAVADPGMLERLARGYRPGVLGVGGAAEPAWPASRPRWFPAEFDWVVGCTYRGLPPAGGAVRNLIGANMSVRRDVLDAVGGFEPGIGRIGKLPLGCEETDLCIRAAEAFDGGWFVFEPSARARHRVTPERTRVRYFVERCFAEGRSKAIVAQRSGAERALATERAYALRTLPLGVARGLADAVVRRDPAGLARSAAIVVGLAVTGIGYLSAKAGRR
jgi:glycosyltransferase involved in cell wall biosynthesis